MAPAFRGTPFQRFSVFIRVRKSWQQLRWRWDVWRWGDTFEPISSYGLRRGAHTWRLVMYYLGLVLPRRLIRAWLREAVTGRFSPSAQERRRTLAATSGSISVYLECKALESHQPLLSRALVASPGYLGDISLMHYLMGHAMVQTLCCESPWVWVSVWFIQGPN